MAILADLKHNLGADFDMRRARRQKIMDAGPYPFMRLEILVEEKNAPDDEGTGNFTGYIVNANGWDEYGTFVYIRSKKRGIVCREYQWFPRNRHVIINEWPK